METIRGQDSLQVPTPLKRKRVHPIPNTTRQSRNYKLTDPDGNILAGTRIKDTAETKVIPRTTIDIHSKKPTLK